MADLESLYLMVFWWTLGVLGAVWLGLAGALIALRARSRSAGADHATGHSRMDVAWTIAPALIVLLVAVPAFRGRAAQAIEPVAGPAVQAITPSPAPDWVELESPLLEGVSEEAPPVTAPDCCESSRRSTTEDDDLVN